MNVSSSIAVRAAAPFDLTAIAHLVTDCIIRLDAFGDNPGAIALYRKLGYWEAGMVRFRRGEFLCFEKSLVEFKCTPSDQSSPA